MIAFLYYHNKFEFFIIHFGWFKFKKEGKDLLVSFSFKIRDIIYTPFWFRHDRKNKFMVFNKINTSKFRKKYIPRYKTFDFLITNLVKNPNRYYSSIRFGKLHSFESLTGNDILIHHTSTQWHSNFEENKFDAHTIINSINIPKHSNKWFLGQTIKKLENERTL